MKDWRQIHQRRAEELYNKGYRLAEEHIGIDDTVLRGRRHTFRPGTIWLWAIQQAWEPPAAQEDSKEAAE
ncbi:hypothetical protein [Rhizobium phage RHEph18]|uniref:hypothetical protein n=1 Tax=Rhizobium TaxID=379 RepID=UPI0007E9CED6|nr:MULTISPECIES: hypothetical protein [Rhizobium]ANL02677.1 hypothetical protein AMJ99_CH01090 [Rhizobium esperanzae]ANM33529.1 hypothetical protein AMK04_CH01091 [Rhizobium sp. N871]QIG73762.1 hypothetical protein EVC05_070 [Rhizobium phage RHph_N2]QXV74480.1 hypothetical protein [Rhizobium phage RHEph18]